MLSAVGSESRHDLLRVALAAIDPEGTSTNFTQVHLC